LKKLFEAWCLTNYAAGFDDSLSLRCLLLVYWDLAHQNSDRKITLEIAAEYVCPKTLSALLNLPIISSAEEHFLSNKEKEILALQNDLGDNPLQITPERGRRKTLQFLICSGADILCHNRGKE